MPTEAIISVVTPPNKNLTVRDIQAWVTEALERGFTLDDELEDYAPLYISTVVQDCYPIECGDHIFDDRQYDVLVPMHVCLSDEPPLTHPYREAVQEELPFPKFDFAARDRAEHVTREEAWGWK